MAVRDRARSDMYLAQLRSQSVPNTPGGPLSPRDGGWRPPPGHPLNKDPLSQAENGEYESQYAPQKFAEPQPFQLMPAPSKAKPAAKPTFASPATPPPAPSSPVPVETRQAHAPTASGETQYAAVSIPGSYASPVNSPGLAPSQPMGGFDFGLQNQR
jgi:hypothetical protein